VVEICLVVCVEILTNRTVVRVPCFIRVFLVVPRSVFLLLVLSSVSGWVGYVFIVGFEFCCAWCGHFGQLPGTGRSSTFFSLYFSGLKIIILKIGLLN
jgi:hypothetical protein